MFVTPSGKEVEIRKMKLSDEDVILDPILARNDETMDVLIERVTGLTKQEVEGLLLGDRVAILVELRRRSRGDLYYPMAVCPNCKDRWEEEIDLSTLETLKLNPDLVDKDFRFPLVLPVSRAELVVKLLRGTDEKELNRIRKKQKDRIMSYLMMVRTVSIVIAGEKKPKDINWFRDLDVDDTDFFRDEYDLRDCGVKTDLERQCPSCSHVFDFQVPFGANFFLQTRKTRKA